MKVGSLQESILTAKICRLAACHDHDRDIVPEAARKLAERIGRARHGMQLHDCGLSGGARIAVGHRHGSTFVQAGRVLQLGTVDQRVEEADLLRPGQAKDIRHLPIDQELRHEFAAGMIFEHPAAFGGGACSWCTRFVVCGKGIGDGSGTCDRYACLGQPGNERATVDLVIE